MLKLLYENSIYTLLVLIQYFIQQCSPTFLLAGKTMETFHWLKEPLSNNLVVLYKNSTLLTYCIFVHCSNLEIAEPLDSDSGTLVENQWYTM